MRKTVIRTAVLATGAALLTSSIALGAATSSTPAFADAATTQARPASTSTAGAPTTPTTVQQQHGVVMEGSGSAGGLDVMVTVYDNSLYGSSVQVVVGNPDDNRIGYVEQATPYVHDGRIDVTLEIDGRPAILSGTVGQTGKSERIVEPMQDNGEQLITRGTHTQLVTDVTLSYGDMVVPLSFAPAFAYALEVRRVLLYGR